MDNRISAHQREQALFAAALERPIDERAAFLDGACHGDPTLRARLDALLAAHERPATELREAGASTVKGDIGIREIDEAIGQTLGRYKILEKVGEGGCGVVYVADQTEPVRRRVALKVIKLGMDTKQVVARFEAERQALAMMDHPNIAKVLDAGTVDFAESQISNFSLERLVEFQHPFEGIEAVAVSPDGHYFATGSGFSSPIVHEAFKIWDVTTRQEVATLAGTGSRFRSARVSKDENTIVAVPSSQVLHVWRAPSWEEFAAAEAHETTRNNQP
jgi:hypothetical protein